MKLLLTREQVSAISGTDKIEIEITRALPASLTIDNRFEQFSESVCSCGAMVRKMTNQHCNRRSGMTINGIYYA